MEIFVVKNVNITIAKSFRNYIAGPIYTSLPMNNNTFLQVNSHIPQ